MFGVVGFRPGGRGPFVSAKGPKTMLAVAWPFGFPARFANTGGAQTRYAQTMRAFPPVLAALLGLATRPGKRLRIVVMIKILLNYVSETKLLTP